MQFVNMTTITHICVIPVAEVGTLRRNYCGATILLAIALAPQLFLNDCAHATAASISAILSAIAQAQLNYDYEGLLFNQPRLKFRKNIDCD